MAHRFNAPPNWPPPPPGWMPPPGWQPDPSWGPPPAGWQLWVEDGTAFSASAPTTIVHPAAAHGPAPSQPPPASHIDIPLFGARGKARELATEVDHLRSEVDGLTSERDALKSEANRLTSEVDRLTSEMNRLGVLPILELEQRRDQVAKEATDQIAKAKAQQAELERQLEQRRDQLAKKVADQIAKAEAQKSELERQLADLRQQVVVTEEIALLQEAGIYRYRHPLTDAIAYQAQLARLQDQIKTMAKKDGGAILAGTGWIINGSEAQGRAMVREYSKLMLRAYNAEADNLVRGLKPYKLESAIDRLSKVAATIARLGKTMDIRIADAYHRLRIKELELTADYLEKVAEEKEREREEKARLREERRVQQEMERERARLDKERQHYANALAAVRAKGDEEGASRLQERLDEIARAIEDVDYRAANVRAGYVYVISNLGAFGEKMVKVGLTRRLDPMDRIRELSDASVPFNFDVHALFFSNDAVGIEAQMHARLADRRVNLVNRRREFFYATPHEVKQHLLELAGDLLQYEEIPEALEYHQSMTEKREPQGAEVPVSTG